MNTLEHHGEYKYLGNLRRRLFVVIFGTDTRSGRIFDIVLLTIIVLSILAVMLESIKEFDQRFEKELEILEWFFTILFTFEYIARLFTSHQPRRYAFSFLGIIDFLALLPTYLSLFVTGTQFLIVIRAIRLLRVFRILKLSRYLGEAQVLASALRSSRNKISVFLVAVLSIVIILGTVMYMVEGGENGFTSIPRSIYWAVVTITTVGYGDIAPQTILGQSIASILMLTGYAIIAVPTGIVTSEITAANSRKKEKVERICHSCGISNHDEDAHYCKNCGEELL
ncbi:MAG: ion transporter [Bacteroidota bacterium]